jgi:hypothetical protein
LITGELAKGQRLVFGMVKESIFGTTQ